MTEGEITDDCTVRSLSACTSALTSVADMVGLFEHNCKHRRALKRYVPGLQRGPHGLPGTFKTDLRRTSVAFVQHADTDGLAVVDPHQPWYRHRQALCHPFRGGDPPASWDDAQDHWSVAEGRKWADNRHLGG
jgi:hypothetical protein